jgi:serine/threonine protein kinase
MQLFRGILGASFTGTRKESNHLSDNSVHEERRIGGYRLLSLLGRGGFGDVYLGEQIRDHSQVAVKILHNTSLTHPKDIKEFINEARMFRLQHSHIVPVLDFGVDRKDTPFLVMQYASHGTLRQRHKQDTLLTPQLVADYVGQVASALQYAHDQQIIHRDVKPENMLLNGDDQVMLSDFGIASVMQSAQSLEENKNVGGTVHYMAPEQIQGMPGPASDQYALGIVTYEWLSGHYPFKGSTYLEIGMQHLMTPPPSLCDQVPFLSPQIETTIFKALAKDPTERFPSIQAFADALQQATQTHDTPSFSKAPARKLAAPRLVSIDYSTLPSPSETPIAPKTPPPQPPIEDKTTTATPTDGEATTTITTHTTITTTQPASPPQSLPSPRLLLARKLLIPALLLLACILVLSSVSIPFVMNNLQDGSIRAPVTALHAIEARPPDYQDALTDEQNKATAAAFWSNYDGCNFSPYGYVVYSARGRQYCHEIGKSYTNFAVRINMMITAGISGALLFRDQTTVHKNGAYVFEVFTDGHYQISNFDHTLYDAASSAIKRGFGVINKLEVIAQGSHLSFFVNDTFLIQVTDTRYSQGPLSLAAFQGNYSTCSVYFTNISVWPIL